MIWTRGGCGLDGVGGSWRPGRRGWRSLRFCGGSGSRSGLLGGVLLLWVQEVAHVLVGGLDAVGGDLGIGAGGEGLWVVVTVAPFFCGPGWCGACLSSLLWSSIVTLSNSYWHSPLILCYNKHILIS